MESEVDALVARGRTALAACEWAAARGCFEQALALGEVPAALDGLGQALYWVGDYARALPLRERAYAGYCRDGEYRAAGFVAVQLAALHLWVYGNEVACTGWIGHARRRLDEGEDGAEHGWLQLLLATLTEDEDEQERCARAAISIGRRCGDVALEYDALGHVGLGLVRRGRVDEGMRLIDESVVAVQSGMVTDPWSAGEIYCSLFGACELAIDVRRAEAWLGAIDGYVRRTGEEPVLASCRMHYGGLLTAAGRWDEAERELTAAIELYERTWRGSRFEPMLRLADLCARQGRLRDTRRLLSGHEHAPEAAGPLARVQLAGGEAALAVATLERCLTRRGRGLGTAPLLELLVEAHLADSRSGGRSEDRADDRLEEHVEQASAVAGELEALARATGQRAVVGLAARARARVATTVGDDAAVAALEQALAAFAEAELPYELARTRLLLAGQLADGRPRLARAEAQAALACFAELHADLDIAAADALLSRLGAARRRPSPRPGDLTPREAEVVALLAEGRPNTEIAEILHISVRTVEDHVSNVLGKLGLQNRTEAAAYALRTGVGGSGGATDRRTPP